MVSNVRAAAALPLLALIASPAGAQNDQQPRIITPPVGSFDIGPRATPTPRPTSSPTSSPTAAPVTIRPVPLPTPRASASATPRPTPAASPEPTRPSPTATLESPPASTGVDSGMTPLTPPTVATPTPTPAPVPVARTERGPALGDLPDWLIPALGGGAALLLVAGLGGGWALGRRRRRREEQDEAVVPPPVSAPVSPPTPGPPPLSRPSSPPVPPRPSAPARAAAPRIVTPPPPGPLVTELRPLRAAIQEGVVTIDFELFVQNRGAESADNIRAVLALLGANADQDAQIAQFHAAARMSPGSEPFTIAGGGVHMLNGQVHVPGDKMAAVTVQGRVMFVPIVPLALRWYAGLSIRTLSDAFMIGTVPAPGSDKLGPLWVDRAAQGFGPLAAKRYVPRPPA